MLAITATALTSLSSCSSPNEPHTAVYDYSVDVLQSGWTSADTLFYDLQLTDPATIKNPIVPRRTYQLSMSVRFDATFPFTTLPMHMLVQQTDTAGGYLHPIRNLLRRDLAPLMRDSIGQPIGHSWGSLVTQTIPLPDLTLRFDSAGTYRILITPHTGSHRSIPGIASVGVRLTQE